MRKLLLLLFLAGAAHALAPEVTLTESPRIHVYANGTQEYSTEYELRVYNPSEKSDIRFFVANYTLPEGSFGTETDENFTEHAGMERTGRIQSGRIPPKKAFSYYYKVRAPVPFLFDASTAGNMLTIQTGTQKPAVLEPKGWTPVSTNKGRIEGGKVAFAGETGELKIAAASPPQGYRLTLEAPQQPAGITVEKIAGDALLSVEKHGDGSGEYLITLTFANPGEFTQEIGELKLLKTNAPFTDVGNASTVWELENLTQIGPGSSREFTTADHSEETPFYWYSTKATIGYNLSHRTNRLVVDADAQAQPAAPTGFSLLGLGKNAPNLFSGIFEALKNALGRLF